MRFSKRPLRTWSLPWAMPSEVSWQPFTRIMSKAIFDFTLSHRRFGSGCRPLRGAHSVGNWLLLLSLLGTGAAFAAEPAGSDQTVAPRLTIDAGKVGPAMSENIYSQFIEHLGRCIYGGLWAEMLEDRKFYFPITADYAPYKSLTDSAYPVVGASPWQITGTVGGVSMVTKDAFVGDHSPRLSAGSGIRQRDL